MCHVTRTDLPITGLRWFEFTSPTGLYAQLIPAGFICLAVANEHVFAIPRSPVAAGTIAPGLVTLSPDLPIHNLQLGPDGVRMELNLDTSPTRA